MHKKISQTMWNFAWCAKFIFGCILWFHRVCEILYNVSNCLSLSLATAPPLNFACYAKFSYSHAKFSYSHAKMLHVGFLPLVFFLASLIGLATYCQAWKRAMKWSKARILHVLELQLALPWIAQNSPLFLVCFYDKKATKNTKTCQKLISNPC